MPTALSDRIKRKTSLEIFRLGGDLLFKLHRYKEMVALYDKALKVCPDDSVEKRLLFVDRRALAKLTICDFRGALEDAYSVYNDAKDVGKGEYVISSSLVIVDLLKMAGLYTLALKYDRESESYLSHLPDNLKTHYTVVVYHNIADELLNIGKVSQSLEVLNKTENMRMTDNSRLMHLLLRGLVAYRMNEYDISESYYRKAYEMGLVNYNTNMALLDLIESIAGSGDINEAKRLISEHRSLIDSLGNTVAKPDISRIKCLILKKEGKWKEYAYALEEYAEIRDSILNDVEQVDVYGRLLELEKEKSDRHVAEIEKSGRSHITLSCWTLFTILLIGITGYFIIRRSRKNRRKFPDFGYSDLEIGAADLNDATVVSRKMGKLADTLTSAMGVIEDETADDSEKVVSLNKLFHACEHEMNARTVFEECFDSVHREFYKHLYQVCPALTPSEVKICGYIRSGMSAKEIADSTHRSVRTVQSIIYNARKKLKIEGSTESWLTKL